MPKKTPHTHFIRTCDTICHWITIKFRWIKQLINCYEITFYVFLYTTCVCVCVCHCCIFSPVHTFISHWTCVSVFTSKHTRAIKRAAEQTREHLYYVYGVMLWLWSLCMHVSEKKSLRVFLIILKRYDVNNVWRKKIPEIQTYILMPVRSARTQQ